MSNKAIDQILQSCKSELGEALTIGEPSYGTSEVTVSADSLIRLVQLLKHNNIDVLIDITAAHFPDREGQEIMAVYHLQDMRTRQRLRIKVYTSAENPKIPTLTTEYAGANWMERETYDFYGIDFVGHPNLIRILNVDEMDYFPMRKQYPLEDQTREDKDDEMFGRKPLSQY